MSVAFGIFYGIIALLFVGLIVSRPPITAEAVIQVEGMKSAEAIGPIPIVSNSTKRGR